MEGITSKSMRWLVKEKNHELIVAKFLRENKEMN